MNHDIYVIVTQTGTLVARTIKKFTKAPYNHSSISLTENLSQMYSFCRVHKHFPLPACFNQEFVDTVVFGMYDDIPCEIYKITVDECRWKKLNALVSYFGKNRSRYPFNLMGFVGIALNIPIHRKHSFTCSQFVAFMLWKSGIHTFKKDLFLIQPEDFRHIPNAEVIYTGNLKDYPYKPYNEIIG